MSVSSEGSTYEQHLQLNSFALSPADTNPVLNEGAVGSNCRDIGTCRAGKVCDLLRLSGTLFLLLL